MNSKKWLAAFALTIIILIGAVAAFNIYTDPFGVFGDRHYNWYSNSMTQNPRVAKIEYLDKNHGKYDSYILGASGTSALSPQVLEEYTGDKYYNLFVYGADMYDTVQMASYVLENYKVKNIILNLAISSAATYQGEKDGPTQYMHAKVTGGSTINFYSRYLTANPNYGVAKIRDKRADTYLQQPFDVFNVADGTYDKSSRDVEAFGELEEYFSKYPTFLGFEPVPKGLGYIDECIESVRMIKGMCSDKGVELTVLFSPMYGPDSLSYSPEAIKKLIKGMADVTGFWDFTLSSISYDPRYFYDTTHFRNDVGRMMLARMYGDDKVFLPDDIGFFVTGNNVEDRVEQLEGHLNFMEGNIREGRLPVETKSAHVPILMYHHLDERGKDSTTISPAMFEKHIKALWDAGYEGVLPQDLIDYVEKGRELPQKPVLITFDDGYMSNYEIAYPILKKYNMKATIFVIGVTAGQNYYKGTGREIIPHFGEKEMREMTNSGLISIQSHTFDMHQSEEMDGPGYRKGVLRKIDEGEDEYIEAFMKDMEKSKSRIKEATGRDATALAYPNGLSDMFSEVLLNKCGIKVTLLTDDGTNTIVVGLPQTLRGMRRIKASDDLPPEELIRRIQN
ncbi:MAG: polysaccharide deacetylase family protein [Anaerovoracaceae bacterium]|jgi:peptidoglycan/xylan/chitin deacetylase (PgdA/CDA1 family)